MNFSSQIYEALPGWKREYWMNAGLFLAMVGVITLPPGAAGGLILLICSVVFLIHGRSGLTSQPLAKGEFWFLGSMALYPVMVLFNALIFVESVDWRYFDNSSRFLMALPVYWAIRESRATPDALVKGSIVGAAAAGLLAGYQCVVLDDPRPGGFGNPIGFSGIVFIMVCISLLPVSLSGTWRWLRVLGVGLGIAAVILANSRGTYIAIPVLVWMMGGWYCRHVRGARIWFVLIALVVTGVLLMTPYSKERIVNQTLHELSNLHESEPRKTSIYIRLERWKGAWILWKEHPWFGVGVGRYWPEMQVLQHQGAIGDIQIPGGDHAHSNYLQLVAEMGVSGILPYLLLLICIYMIGHQCCRRRLDGIGVMLKIFAVGQGIYSLTDSQFSINYTCTFFAMTAVMLVALAFNELERGDFRSDRFEKTAGSLSQTNRAPVH